MNEQLVSICIPTFNGETYIGQAIQSVLNQSYKNLEIIISDDESKDGTLKIIEKFQDNSNIPIHVYSHTPSGIGSNWNNSIKKASGKYIKFLFQDDVLEPNCIEKMLNILLLDSSIGLVASKREFIVEESFKTQGFEKWIETYGNLQQGLNLKKGTGFEYLDNHLFSDPCFFESPLNKIGEPSTFMFSKDLINKIGYFSESLKQVLDYEFCYRVLKKQKIAIIDEKLVRFRLHGKQTTVLNKHNNAYSEDFRIYEKILYKEYSGYLAEKHRRRLTQKYNIYYRVIKKLKKKLG